MNISEATLSQIIALISLVVSAWVKYSESKQKARLEETKVSLQEADIKAQATQDGVFALLKDRIISEYRRIMDRKDPVTGEPFIHVYELENIEKLNNEYRNLGGNGTVAQLMKELKDISIRT